MEKTKLILLKILFSPELIGKVVKSYLNNQYNNKESLNKKEGRYSNYHMQRFFLDTLSTK